MNEKYRTFIKLNNGILFTSTDSSYRQGKFLSERNRCTVKKMWQHKILQATHRFQWKFRCRTSMTRCLENIYHMKKQEMTLYNALVFSFVSFSRHMSSYDLQSLW